MWNMKAYKYKLKISRLERKTYIHVPKIGTKIGSVGLVETNNFFTPKPKI